MGCACVSYVLINIDSFRLSRNLKFSIFSSVLSNIFQAKANLHISKDLTTRNAMYVRREFGYEPQKGLGLQIESLIKKQWYFGEFLVIRKSKVLL